MDQIISDIKSEREYQVLKWGTDADDKLNRPMDYVGYIANHSTRWFNGGFAPYNRETLENFNAQMVKVAAIAVAAIESTNKILECQIERNDVLATN